MEISKQLLDMTKELPLIKQCLRDVKSGKYTTMDAARIAAGGIVEQQVDAITGVPVKVQLDPTEIVS